MSCTAYTAYTFTYIPKKITDQNNLNMYFLITLLKAGKYHANMKNIHWK